MTKSKYFAEKKILRLLFKISRLFVICLSKSNIVILLRNWNNQTPIKRTTKNAVLRTENISRVWTRGDGLIRNSNNLRIPRRRPYPIKHAENTRWIWRRYFRAIVCHTRLPNRVNRTSLLSDYPRNWHCYVLKSFTQQTLAQRSHSLLFLERKVEREYNRRVHACPVSYIVLIAPESVSKTILLRKRYSCHRK